MKKLLLTLSLFGSFALVNAEPMQASAPQPMNTKPFMDPVCRDFYKSMKPQQEAVLKAINANNSQKVGTLVIQNHKTMESFMKKNPQCQMRPHDMMGKKMFNASQPK